jgi:hypothetical protein
MNTITPQMGGAFWIMVLLGIFIVALVYLLRFGFDDALLPSLFITTTLSILMRIGNLVPDWFVGFLIIVTALVVLYRYVSNP